MRENRRIRNDKKGQDKARKYIILGTTILVVILIGMLIYSKSLSNKMENGVIDLEEIAKQNEMLNDTNSESVSTDIGKSIEEAENVAINTENMKNETLNSTNTNSSNNQVNNTNSSSKANEKKNKINKTNSNKSNNNNNSKSNADKKSANEEPKFEKPIEGDIIKEYAKDNLVYSNTLQEWTTHLGIDIKADKTTVVKSAEAGTIKSIKNDPRYGLTIVIDHGNGYQTIYSNLLSSEFIVEGENVEKGQSIGTVGDTASFESVDDPHLHFEILKDSIQVDPTIYFK